MRATTSASKRASSPKRAVSSLVPNRALAPRALLGRAPAVASIPTLAVIPSIALFAALFAQVAHSAGAFGTLSAANWLALGVIGAIEGVLLSGLFARARFHSFIVPGLVDAAFIFAFYPPAWLSGILTRAIASLVLGLTTAALAKTNAATWSLRLPAYRSASTPAPAWQSALFRALAVFFVLASLNGPFVISFVLFAAALTFALKDVQRVQRVADYLHLDASKPWLSQLASGLKLFALLFAALLVESVVLSWLGVLDASKVADVLTQQSVVTLVFAFTFAPIAEELFFRGYVQNKVGVVLTAIVFGALHAGFGSLFEVLAAVTAGLVLGEYVRRTNNLIPAILAHALYNLYAVIMLIGFIR